MTRLRLSPEAAIAMVVTAVLLMAEALSAPSWFRLPLALVTFFLAPGLAVIGPALKASPALRWSMIIGFSVAVDLVGAWLLLTLGLISALSFLTGMLVLLVLIVGVRAMWSGTAPHAARHSSLGR